MLSEYLEKSGRAPWRWGRMDCCMFTNGWIREATGKDPYEAFPGGYATAADAKRIIIRAGGFVSLVSGVMAGFDQTDEPETGDVAIIKLPRNNNFGIAGHALVIRLGNWWVGRSETGIAGVEAPHEIAWRIL